MRVVTAVIGCAVLLACGSSPPTHFFALDAVAPDPHPPTDIARPFKVDAVHIPPELDRTSIVRGEQRNQVNVSSQDRWVADFGEMALNVLTEDLQRRLPAGTVIPSNAPAPDSARGLVVDILSFGPDTSGRIVLDADWTLLAGSPPQSTRQRSVHVSAPGGSSAQSEAAAMSALLGQLADNIAAGVSAH